MSQRYSNNSINDSIYGQLSQIKQGIADMLRRMDVYERNMVPRQELDEWRDNINGRLIKVESSPAALRAWLALAITGIGCLGSLVIGGASIAVTVILFVLR